MKKAISTVLCGTAALLSMAFCGGAAAQATWSSDVKWDFGTPCNTPTCIAGGIQLDVAGYGNGGAGGAYIPGTVTNQGQEPLYGVGLGFRSSTSTSSAGNETTNSPNHGFDNRGGSSSGTNFGTTNEVLVLNFGASKVNLTSIATGWSNTDTDVMVFRWDDPDTTDNITAPAMGSTAGPTGLLAAGWSLVSAKDLDGTTGTSATNFTGKDFDLSTGVGYDAASAGKLSSWWLVSSYFTGTGSVSGTNLDTSTKDYFKLLSFTGRACTSATSNGTCVENPPQTAVPEPASLALVAVALAGVAGSRRRRKTAA